MEGLERSQTKFLLYHDLASLTGGDKGLAREAFRRQLSLISGGGYRFRSMSDFLDGDARGAKDVVITFDDGGRSLIDTALPVLEEFSAPATMFAVAGYLGRSGSKLDFLSWDELGEAAARGVDVGSHTLSHQPLIGTDRDAITREIEGARELFARHGFSPRTFAYPYGRRSDVAKDVVRAAGFEAAFMIKKGGHDAFELRRRLFTLRESPALMRFFLSDHYFGVRNAVVATIPNRYRRDMRPLPPTSVGGKAFGIDDSEYTAASSFQDAPSPAARTAS